MPEWSNGPHSKCGVLLRVPWVRIPVSPLFVTSFSPPMKKTLILVLVLALAAAAAGHARSVTVTVSNTRYQTITGFGAAACDGAMCPYASDTNPVKLLYGKESKIGLNIMRMEISPNFLLCLLFMIFMLGQTNWMMGAGSVLPIMGLELFMTCLELLVAFLQAYVFTLLTAIFAGAVIHTH